MARAPQLESHAEFEGVGAHELNLRYDHVDGGDWDEGLREAGEVDRRKTPALFAAQGFLSLAPIRFDGADISHHQDDAGPIDWPTLRAASLGGWVATKATQSTTYTDPTCDPHRAQMAAQAFTHRGLYHWLSPKTDPTAQAAHYMRCVGTLHPGEFVMLDAEERGITAAMCLEWLHVVEDDTHRPASVYSGAYVAGGTIWQNTQIRTSPFGPRPMHLAAYTTEAKMLKLPGVAAYPQSAWQYSSNGPVPGVTGRCDMNRIDRVDHYDLAAGITLPPPQPPQGDLDMKLVQVPGDAAVILLAGLDATWVQGDSSGLAAAFGPIVAVNRSTFKAFYLDGPEPSYPGPGPTKLADFKGRRPAVVAEVPPIVIPPITVPPLTGHLAADIDTGTWHITGSIG